MFGVGGSVRVYYCPTPVNLRKSFDGLAGAVEQHIRQDPQSGHMFVFFSRNKKLVKILQWQPGGFTIWMQRAGNRRLPPAAIHRRQDRTDPSRTLGGPLRHQAEAVLQKICGKII